MEGGVGAFGLSVYGALFSQYITDTTSLSLNGIWNNGDMLPATEETLGALLALGYVLRALGLMLIGAGLYRSGFMGGGLSAKAYRMTATIGVAVGLPLAATGVIITAASDYSREVAFAGQIPNILSTIPFSLGYMSAIILWNNGVDNWFKIRLRAVGRMALTNYLAQTVMGVVVLTIFLGETDSVNRSVVLLLVFAAWALQLWWSHAWLSRFLFGPAEWLWRVGTYRKRQPLRRAVSE